MKTNVSILLALFLLQLACAQNEKQPTINPMEKLHFMMGNWEGDGWMMTRKGKETSRVKEVVGCKLNCSILVAEGLGTKIDPETNETKVVHNAFGVVHYDQASQTFKMRAYKEGSITETEIEFLEPKKLRWHLDVGNGSKVRFTVDFTQENKWIEIGEFSQDGENWKPFLGMNLTRVNN